MVMHWEVTLERNTMMQRRSAPRFTPRHGAWFCQITEVVNGTPVTRQGGGSKARIAVERAATALLSATTGGKLT